MTEVEWLACSEPKDMLQWCRGDRKLRLFACACCRRVWDKLDATCRGVVEVSERFADGLATREELETARFHVPTQYRAVAEEYAENAASYTAFAAARAAAYGASEATFFLDEAARRGWQCELLRDIFLRRSVALNPTWLAANDRAVTTIAAAIYEGNAFDRLPILADALEDAGCDEQAMLSHCRGGGLHVRGCWCVDLLLARQ